MSVMKKAWRTYRIERAVAVVKSVVCSGFSAILMSLCFWSPLSLADSNEYKATKNFDVAQPNWERLTNKIPDITVIDQEGKQQLFYTDLVKDRTVAINFIYTTCNTVCPVLTEIFRHTHEILNKEENQHVRLISVSVDPFNDTAQKLKGFAAKLNAKKDWVFVAAEKSDLDRLLKALGTFSTKRDDHSSMVLIGNDRHDRWIRSYGIVPATELVQILHEVQGSE